MLETDRLILREVGPLDAQYLFDLNSDPEVIRYTGDLAFASALAAQKFIIDTMIPQFQRHHMARLLVFRKEDQEFLGWCGLKYYPETAEVDLGYRFRKVFWGMGFATEASRACLSYGFKTLKLEKIIAKAMPQNTASIKVMQKLGMDFRGYVHDPTDPHPFVLFEIKKEKFA